MGYNTRFEGVLKFTPETPVAAIRRLKEILGDNEAMTPKEYGNNYIDIVITDDLTGIKWNDECEKSYGMVETINYLLDEVRKTHPEFGLTGMLLAQGEDIRDVWNIVIKDGTAIEKRIDLGDSLKTCPECGHQWRE